MAVFEWRGIDARGKEIRGVRDADNAKVLRTLLKKDGVLLTQALEGAQAQKAKAREVDFGKMFRRVSTLDVAMTTRQFATLLKSGVPLVESMSALIDQMESPELKTALTQTRDRAYAVELEAAGATPIRRIGIGFSGKDVVVRV